MLSCYLLLLAVPLGVMSQSGEDISLEDKLGYLMKFKRFHEFAMNSKAAEEKEHFMEKAAYFKKYSTFRDFVEKVQEMKGTEGHEMSFEEEKSKFDMFVKAKMFFGKMKELKEHSEMEKKKAFFKKMMMMKMMMHGDDMGGDDDDTKKEQMIERFHKFMAHIAAKKSAAAAEKDVDADFEKESEGMDYEKKEMLMKMFAKAKKMFMMMKEHKEHEAYMDKKEAFEKFMKLMKFIKMVKGEKMGEHDDDKAEHFAKFIKMVKMMKAMKGDNDGADGEFEKEAGDMDMEHKMEAYKMFAMFKKHAMKMREEQEKEAFEEKMKKFQKFVGLMKFIKMAKQAKGDSMGEMEDNDEMSHEEKHNMFVKFMKMMHAMKAKAAMMDTEKECADDFEQQTDGLEAEDKMKAFKKFMEFKKMAEHMKAVKEHEEMEHKKEVFMKFIKFMKFVKFAKHMMAMKAGMKDGEMGQGMGQGKGQGMGGNMEAGNGTGKEWSMEQKMHVFEKFKGFKEFVAYAEKRKAEQAYTEKKAMFGLFEKKMKIVKSMEKTKHMMDFIDEFRQKKHEVAFTIAHDFVKLCHCAEVNSGMHMMTGAKNESVSDDMMDGMDGDNAMESLDKGDMFAFAAKLKSMTKKEQKKVFMVGMVKSICNSAKLFITQAKAFKKQYMMGN